MAEVQPDFEVFYEERLHKLLLLFGRRSKFLKTFHYLSLILALAGVALFSLLRFAEGLVAFMLATIAYATYNTRYPKFRYEYKKSVIENILKFLNPETQYFPTKRVSEKSFLESGLFAKPYTNYIGEDLFTGTYKGVRFICSEIFTEMNTTDDRGDSTFSGLLFCASIPVHQQGQTYVWPGDDVQLPATLGDEYFERFRPLPEVHHILSMNKEFGKLYSVYTNNPTVARAILNEQMQQAIVSYQKQIRKEIRISFVSGKCYVSISTEEDMFEPSIQNPGSRKIIKEYFFSMLLIFSIINQLKLYEL